MISNNARTCAARDSIGETRCKFSIAMACHLAEWRTTTRIVISYSLTANRRLNQYRNRFRRRSRSAECRCRKNWRFSCVGLPSRRWRRSMFTRTEHHPPSLKLRRDSLHSPLTTRAKTGGKGIRTPDFQLAKLALYQLSYAPVSIGDFRLPMADCKCDGNTFSDGTSLRPSALDGVYSRHPAFVRLFERAKLRSRVRMRPFSCSVILPSGTAKYAVLTLFSSIALPVISPLSFMSLALSRRAEKSGCLSR